MLIDEYKDIKITRWNKDYYNKFKDCEVGDVVSINIYNIGDSLQNNSVLAKCDYCGCEFEITIRSLIRIKNNNFNNKHACKECLPEKRKETNLLKYGVDNPMKVEEFKESLRQTNQEIYGVDNVFQNEKIKEKARKTIYNKYGVKHIMHLDEIKNRVIRKSRKTMSENGIVSTSKQQIYLAELYEGELNHSYDKIVLDIAFPDENIYIEYNGGGHDLSVKCGRETQEEYEAKERKRFHFLRSKGWNLFLIESPRDYLPDDEFLLEEFENAKQFFKNGKSRYTISLEEKIQSKKYGTMRKIS